MKRTLAILLAMLMLVSVLAACSNEPAANTPSTDAPATTDTPATSEPADEPAEAPADEPTEEPAETPADESTEEPAETPTEPTGPVEITYPLVDTPVTYEVIADGQIASSMPELEGDLNNVLAVQKISEVTGVNIKWNIPVDTATTVSLMLVSEDYTDGLAGNNGWLGSSVDYFIEEEILLDLTDIMRTSCPNYWNLVNSDEQMRRDAVTDKGYYAEFYKVSDERPQCYMGYYVRTDVLEEAGFSAQNLPVTYEDFETILVAGKDDASNAPLYLDQSVLLTGYDVNTGFVHNGDNQLYYGPTSDSYRDYLAMLADWNAQGLIERDFATRITFFLDAGVFMNREVIAFPTVFSFRNVFEGAGLDITSIPYPKLNEGDQRYQSGAVLPSRVASGGGLKIFATCENPTLLAQWWDYCYSEEGTMLTNFGVEGVSYNYDENGEIAYVPDFNLNTATFATQLPYMALNWREYIGESEAVTNDRAVWGADWSYEMHFAMGKLSAEESEDVSAIMNDIDTYRAEYSLGVISGTRSIDEWDDYVAYVESLGLAECTAAYQAAHDRYFAR